MSNVVCCCEHMPERWSSHHDLACAVSNEVSKRGDLPPVTTEAIKLPYDKALRRVRQGPLQSNKIPFKKLLHHTLLVNNYIAIDRQNLARSSTRHCRTAGTP